ncbi:MAG TPA: hypothetical protein VLC55_11300 [Burkholderiales bacterium]|nr:hypothetical protein [Burkholderiales bacterium]
MRARLLALVCTGVAAALISAAPFAAEHPHHDQGAPATLTLDQGRKWPTDEPLRQGMERMRAAMAQALPAIHADTTKAPQYRSLAGPVQKEVAYIVANCHLAPDADAMLHQLIAELLAGADAMQGKAKGVTPREGAIKVVQALDDYGRYFDHPGWQPLTH